MIHSILAKTGVGSASNVCIARHEHLLIVFLRHLVTMLDMSSKDIIIQQHHLPTNVAFMIHFVNNS